MVLCFGGLNAEHVFRDVEEEVHLRWWQSIKQAAHGMNLVDVRMEGELGVWDSPDGRGQVIADELLSVTNAARKQLDQLLDPAKVNTPHKLKEVLSPQVLADLEDQDMSSRLETSMLLSLSDNSNIHLIHNAVIAKLPDGKKVFEGEKVLNDLMAIKRTLAVKLAGEEAVDNVNLAIQVLQSVLGFEEVQGKWVTGSPYRDTLGEKIANLVYWPNDPENASVFGREATRSEKIRFCFRFCFGFCFALALLLPCFVFVASASLCF